MGTISVSLPSDGETIDATDYNTPINTIVNEINGDLDNANIASDAAIAGTKLATSALFDREVNDTSGNEVLQFAATASAVNELTITNAATGNGPTLSATGGDTNIDLNLNTKGTGSLKVNSKIIVPGWTTYTPTTAGWSGTPTVTAMYMRLGDFCTVYINADGTSNAATTTISLPFEADNSLNVRALSNNYDGTNDVVGVLQIIGSSNPTFVESRKGVRFDASGNQFTNWASSGTKTIVGATITYKLKAGV